METKNEEIDQNYKQFYDNIHNYIKVSNIACKIIDSKPFQRLRSLHQLGTCHYVFPTATHTRFEHSIGTYYLTGRLLNNIKNKINKDTLEEYLKNISELKEYYEKTNNYILDNYICELIKIGGLCHDLGHGPFSHVFDDIFLQNNNSKMKTHEARSNMLLEHIINTTELKDQITKSEIEFIKNIIKPKKTNKGFLYQIVSNSETGIDVDKFDYILRDTKTIGLLYSYDFSRLIDDIEIIDNCICYPKKLAYDLTYLYKTRFRLHKQVYRHKVTINTQTMINNIMKYLDSIINFSSYIDDPNKFCKLTDNYILSLVDILYERKESLTKQQIENITNAYNLNERLLTRDLYYFVDSINSKTKISLDFDQLNINHSNIEIYKSTITTGCPDSVLSNVWFFDKNNKNTKFKINKFDIGNINLQNEYILFIFMKEFNDHDYTIIKEHINKYKTF